MAHPTNPVFGEVDSRVTIWRIVLINLQTYKTYFRIVSAEGCGPPEAAAALLRIQPISILK